MERLFVEIKATNNMRTPKRGLGTRAEVSGITIEQHKILESMSWCLNKGGYFRTDMFIPQHINVYLHQIVNNMRYGIEPLYDNTYVEYGLQIDHIDTNTLNCRPDNLRYLTDPMNKSRKSKKGRSSQYYGVSWYKANNKWTAYYHNGKKTQIGSYDTEEEAARARDKAVRELGLDLAINFP